MRVATAVGGTFTDTVVFNDAAPESNGAVRVTRADSTPPDLEADTLNGIQKAGVKDSGFDPFVHGTAAVIYAVFLRQCARTGLITTVGCLDAPGEFGFDHIGVHPTRITIRDRHPAGHALVGPAVKVEKPVTTVCIPPGRQPPIDSLSNLCVTRAKQGPRVMKAA